jgi:hypothetical protein
MAVDTSSRVEDRMPVHSRIAWQAVIAGSVLALSFYLLLALLGSAIGFSLSDKVSAQGLNSGAVVYAIVVTAGCLFLGGYVASQLTTGESKIEGSMYGIFVWATVFTILVGLTVLGVRVGFNAMVGAATEGKMATDAPREDWEAVAERNGISKQQIEEAKQRAKDAPAKAKATEDPQNQQVVTDTATRMAWYTFLGAWLSMMAAVAGGYLGSGPASRLFTVWTERMDHDKRAPTVHA